MPLEIRELIIKAVVGEEAGGQNQGGNTEGGGATQDEIIRQCVEQVMAILKEKQER